MDARGPTVLAAWGLTDGHHVGGAAQVDGHAAAHVALR